MKYGHTIVVRAVGRQVAARDLEMVGACGAQENARASAHLFALKVKTKSIASITFDLPLPLGPTTDVMCRSNGPTLTLFA
jgi:hypothetical protein